MSLSTLHISTLPFRFRVYTKRLISNWQIEHWRKSLRYSFPTSTLLRQERAYVAPIRIPKERDYHNRRDETKSVKWMNWFGVDLLPLPLSWVENLGTLLIYAIRTLRNCTVFKLYALEKLSSNRVPSTRLCFIRKRCIKFEKKVF